MKKHVRQKPEKVGLPPRPFLYTVDQVAGLISMSVPNLSKKYIYYYGRSVGTLHRRLLARNINPDPEGKPEWRISEADLIKWMNSHGFRYYERGWLE